MLEVDRKISKDPGGNGLVLADDSEQNVLSADAVIAAIQRLRQRQDEELLRSRCERGLSCSPRPTDRTTCSRASASVTPNDANARAATPSCTANKPNSRC